MCLNVGVTKYFLIFGIYKKLYRTLQKNGLKYPLTDQLSVATNTAGYLTARMWESELIRTDAVKQKSPPNPI